MSGLAARLALWTGVLLSAARFSPAQQVLYGGNEWLQFPSVNTGWLVSVDPETGATTLIGRPAGVDRISGLAFDAAGLLWATSLTGTESGTVRTSTLLKLDPNDGSLLETIGPVLDGPGGPPMSIESLAFQPGAGLFSRRGASPTSPGPMRATCTASIRQPAWPRSLPTTTAVISSTRSRSRQTGRSIRRRRLTL